MRALTLIVYAALLVPALVAQKPTFTWQKQTSKFEYNPTFIGKHTLDDFKSDQPWMMGSDKTTLLRTTMPVVVGDAVIPPGTYPISMKRTGESTASVQVKGSGKARGSESDVEIEGQIAKSAKSVSQLVIGWKADAKPDHDNQRAHMIVQFGESEWRADALFPGCSSNGLPGWTFTMFTLPVQAFAARDKLGVTIATFKKGRDVWNVVVHKESADLVLQPRVEGPIATEAIVDSKRTLSATFTKIELPRDLKGTDLAAHVLYFPSVGESEPVGPGADPTDIWMEVVCLEEAFRIQFRDPKPAK